MTETERLKQIAAEAANKVLAEYISDKEYQARINDVMDKYKAVLSLNPDDIDAQFNILFFTALACAHIQATQGGLDNLKGICETTLNQLSVAEIPVEDKQKFLADFSLRIEKIMSDFCKKTQDDADLLLYGNAYVLARNPNASSWRVSKLQTFQSILDKASEDIIARSLTFASAILGMLNQLNLENKYACIAHIAKSAIQESLQAPAFAYNDKFYDRHEALFKQMVLVVKTSAPHEVYYVQEPSYYRTMDIVEVGSELRKSYNHSKLKRLITELNAEAKAEAVCRYWETHPDDKEALEKELETLEKKLDESLAVKEEKAAAVKKAEADAAGERDQLLQPEEAKIHDIETEIQSLNKNLSSLNIFQFNQKKALRAELDAKQMALFEAKKNFKELNAKAEAVYREKTDDPHRQLREAEQIAHQLNLELKEIQKKLEDPLEK